MRLEKYLRYLLTSKNKTNEILSLILKVVYVTRCWGVVRCRRVGVGARAAPRDVPADALAVLHVLPPRRRRAAGRRAHGRALPGGRDRPGACCAILSPSVP